MLHSLYSYILNCIGTFLIVFFSLSVFPSCVSLLLWHLNTNLLCSGTLFVPGHLLLLLILQNLMSSFVMRRPNWTSLRTLLDEAFIWNAKLFCRTSPTLTFLLSSTVGNGGHCVTSRSPVYPCLFRSSTPTCMDLIFQYLSLLLAFEVRIWWSL